MIITDCYVFFSKNEKKSIHLLEANEMFAMLSLMKEKCFLNNETITIRN